MVLGILFVVISIALPIGIAMLIEYKNRNSKADIIIQVGRKV